MGNKINNQGQITIFIVLALILVVGIVLIFMLARGPKIVEPAVDEPDLYIEKCVRDATKEALEVLSPRGGDIAPTNYKLHKDIPRKYLCYTANYYQGCINQEPMLIEHIEKEITEYVTPRVEKCFADLEAGLERKDYEINLGGMGIETELKPKKVVVSVNREIGMKKNEVDKRFKKFSAQIIHPIYDLAEIAIEIANQEAEFCYFENLGFMIFYPDYDIQKFVTSDSVKIYTIKEPRSEKEFVFAIRGCVIPPGF